MALNYIICTTPRSGSTFLCNGLSKLGILGKADEWFIEHVKDEFRKSLGKECSEASLYQKIIETQRAEGHGVFALKAMYYNLEHYCDACKRETESMLETVQRGIGETRFIYLTRRDTVMQAISHFKAKQNDVWFDYGQPIKEKIRLEHYNFDAIHVIYQTINESNRKWCNFFDKFNIHPLHLVYEDVSNEDEYPQSINTVLKHLGKTYPGRISKDMVGIRKMADQVSLQMKEQFIKDLEERTVIPTAKAMCVQVQ